MAVHPSKVIMIETAGNGVEIWFDGSNIPLEVHIPMPKIVKLFPEFVRCHMYYLVNPNQIYKVNFQERWVLVGSQLMKASISPSGVYRENLRKLMSNDNP